MQAIVNGTSDRSRLPGSRCELFAADLRDCIVYHNANGGARSYKTAKLMKRIGVLAGVFDLTILAPGGQIFFIECKAKSGSLSPEQTAFKLALIRLGIRYAVIKNFDDLEAALIQWGLKKWSAVNAMEYGDLLGNQPDRQDVPAPAKRAHRMRVTRVTTA
jgi:hypothetical protein